MFSIFWLSCTCVKSKAQWGELIIDGWNYVSRRASWLQSSTASSIKRSVRAAAFTGTHKNTSSSWEQLIYWSPLHNKARHTHSSATRGLGFDRDWNKKWTASAFSSSSSYEHLFLWDASVTIIHTEPGVFSCARLFSCYGHMGNESMYPYISLKNQKNRTWIQSTTVR